MKRIVALSVGLWAASWAAEDPVQQMLPLAVGNTWEYWHGRSYVYDDGTLDEGTFSHDQLVTISITHTENIGGHTYYVFSDMPYEEPPVPAFFLAGKKVRWDGNHLLFRQQDEDVALYQFTHNHAYSIPPIYTDITLPIDIRDFYDVGEIHPDTLVLSTIWERGMRRGFTFHFNGIPMSLYGGWKESRRVTFVEGMGLFECVIEGYGAPEDYDVDADPTGASFTSSDHPVGLHNISFHSALINGVKFVPMDIYQETVVRPSSWGVLKRKFTCPECED